MADDPLAEAAAVVDASMPVEVARALGSFRQELANYEAIDVDEATAYGQEFLAQLVAAWLPQPEPDE